MKNLENLEYSEVKQDERAVEKPNLKGDRRNFAFLILLYVLQGVPQGISVAIPILLQNRGVSYNDQAEFSISYFPFSSTANSVGQQAGKFIGFIIFLVFESKDFCNSYIFSEPRNQGLFTLSGFLMFWAIIYLLITILIAIFKSEKCETSQELHETTDYGIKRAYPILVDIIKLKPVIQLCTMIFTIEACFAAIDAVSSLKLIEYGVPKDKFALLSIPSAPVQILFPLFITKFTTGRKPLSFYFKLFPCRVITMILITFFVYNTRAMLASDNSILYFYVGIIILFLFDQCLTRATYAADGSFFSKIADPLVGGTYMTLINTFGTLGKRVSVTFFLWLVDKITWKQCSSSANTFSVQNSTTINTCANI
ncbi:hypothetical protein PVAND_011092 [Polypedilum vanderplanki]|uniref:Acetyl-coenzyme A transporter 1 n=1 Tax=Polypedilum vanderplanki TaxID=319348 RepID=A0A9J6CII7_POLVA|nr:hypothetical protein PVAND_011092 [Polypedilum vanderplanki]